MSFAFAFVCTCIGRLYVCVYVYVYVCMCLLLNIEHPSEKNLKYVVCRYGTPWDKLNVSVQKKSTPSYREMFYGSR